VLLVSDGVVVADVPLGMGGMLFGLFTLHRKQREREREKRVQYWREQVRYSSPCPLAAAHISCTLQNTFLENIRQMRDTAQASILSLHSHGGRSGNQTPRSMMSRDHLGSWQEESTTATGAGKWHYQAPPTQRSGLRHNLAEDGSSGVEVAEMLSVHRRSDGRF
jgi:hypothetical protein